MTKEEILAMKPGNKLDTLIAEKVMELEVIHGYTFKKELIPCPDNKPGCCVTHYGMVPHKIPSYSTDIVAAWDIVELLDSKNLTVGIHNVQGGWICRITPMKEDKVFAKTAPEAIAKAALLAVLEGNG